MKPQGMYQARQGSFFRFVMYLLAWLVVVQIWPFWELSQRHRCSHGSASRAGVLAPLGGTCAEAGAVSIYGPRKYVRTTGKPDVYTDRLSATSGSATLVIVNGEADGSHRISSAVVTLNGMDILGTRDFNQNVYRLRVAIDLAAMNMLVVELRSKPDSYLTIEILPEQQNTPPTADAGPDQTVFVSQVVTLDGSRSADADGDSLTYRWSFLSKPSDRAPTLSDPTAVNPTFTVDTNGDYVLQLIVNDGHADSAPDTVTITTQNSPPVANAGPDQTVFVSHSVTLDGAGSSDVDGDPLTFSWSFVSMPAGSAAALSDMSAIKPTFIADRPGAYVIGLIVNDGRVNSAADTVMITTENSPPVADAGSDQSVLLNRTVTLDGSRSYDVDEDPLTFQWSLASRPAGSRAVLSDFAAHNPTFVADKPGIYVAQLIVNDGRVNSAADTVTITTENSPPVADAGSDQIVFVTQVVTLDGSGSTDVDSDPVMYSWSLIAMPVGSMAFLSDPGTIKPTFAVDKPGTYVAQLVVNDGSLSSAPDTVAIITENRPPFADAGPDQSAIVGQIVTLNGDGSSDVDGDPLTFSWSFVTRPDLSAAILTGPTTANPSFTVDRAGSYTVQLIVNDRTVNSSPDIVVVVVTTPNRAPIAQEDTFTGEPGQTLIVPSPGVLANDTDPDGNALTASIVQHPTSGSVVLNPDGSFTYTPTPPVPLPSLHLRLKWSWTSSTTLPNSLNVIMTPAVVDLNSDGLPDVVFGTTASRGGGFVEAGVLRAVNGADGHEIFTVTDPALAINAFSQIAVGDIDGDGLPEIMLGDASGQRLIAFEHDGSLKWRSPVLDAVNWGGPALADLDGDGNPEIIIGRQALNNDGTIRWSGSGGRGTIFSGSTGIGPISLVSDVDLDGLPEVIAGNTAYRSDGTMKWQASAPDGYGAVGNFDDDPYAEIVLVSGGTVRLLEHDGAIKWGPLAIPGAGRGGPPTVADFDGDGKPEIGVAGASRYTVIETGGTVKWQAVTQDVSSNVTGSSVFDFEGDGSAEVVYRDELKLRVYRGVDGAVLFESPLSSCTGYEYMPIVDVDGDGHAEIVASANNCGLAGPQRGLYVFADAGPGCAATRKIWNQYTYHITNVNEDGTIPRREDINWLFPDLNNFRLNTFAPADQVLADSFTYKASDSFAQSNEATVRITLQKPNQAPVITTAPALAATVGQPYSYEVNAIDPDRTDTLTFSLPGAPQGMTIDSATGLIAWTPMPSQGGSQSVTVKVQDGGGLAAFQTFIVTVSVPALLNAVPY